METLLCIKRTHWLFYNHILTDEWRTLVVNEGRVSGLSAVHDSPITAFWTRAGQPVGGWLVSPAPGSSAMGQGILLAKAAELKCVTMGLHCPSGIWSALLTLAFAASTLHIWQYGTDPWGLLEGTGGNGEWGPHLLWTAGCTASGTGNQT